ncbi:hypothetical protein [Roseomonas fluvialis]|uniref:Uncharacterized protein n=1 Tax=Roseomonas fluvialis TaxID=1750527 RepID=A0ABN6NYP9_9PROT|nr:hypothetical protein [Roseomonas fluvialis]BDG70617.1 hypothetical protein Rmf_05460 [Roseomonas fluvialis]
MDRRHPIRGALKSPVLLLAFLWVLLEETLWRWARAVGGLIARIPVFSVLERLILRMDARIVLLLFGIPIVALVPVKIAALWLFGTGHWLLGAGTLLLAKTVGVAFSARLYVVAEPKLMTIPAFARTRNWVVALVAGAHAVLDALPAWQAVRRAIAAVHGAVEALRARLAWRGGALVRRVRVARAQWRRRA